MCLTVRPHRRPPTGLLCPWDSPSKNTANGKNLHCVCIETPEVRTSLCPQVLYTDRCYSEHHPAGRGWGGGGGGGVGGGGDRKTETRHRDSSVFGMRTLIAFQKQVGASPGWWGFPLQIVYCSHFLTHRKGR